MTRNGGATATVDDPPRAGPGWLAGVGRSVITPPLDIPNGWWRTQEHVRAQALDMDLYATALVFARGDERVALIDLDLCILFDEQDAAIRQACQRLTGLPPERVWPICTHNHAAPQTQPFYEGEGDDRVAAYLAGLPMLVASAVLRACGDLRPARVVGGRGQSDVGVNRDWPSPDGAVLCGPNPDGFVDHEVGVLRIDALDGQPIACVLNYACHPITLGPGNVHVTPDYPGHARRAVERATGATCVFLQGAGGNVGPRWMFQSDPAVARRLGTSLGCEAARVHQDAEERMFTSTYEGPVASGAPLASWRHDRRASEVDADLRIASTKLALRVRSPLPPPYRDTEADLARWQATLDARVASGASQADIHHALHFLTFAKMRHGRATRLAARDSYEIEMHALRIGDVAMLVTWGEMYAEIGRAVKDRSPFPCTLFVGYLGGEGGLYVTTAEAFDEPRPFENHHCPFEPDAAERVVAAGLALLRSLAAPPDPVPLDPVPPDPVPPRPHR